MQTRQVCSTCHHVSKGPAGDWRIAEVKQTRRWMAQARFTHAKHATQTCISCHDVRLSRRAQDVALPGIARCRDCHAGVAGAPNKVASDCATWVFDHNLVLTLFESAHVPIRRRGQ